MSLLRSSTVNFEKVWENIQPPLISLVSGMPQTLTNEKWLDMYSGIYKICTNPGAPQAEMLFFRLRGLLVAHVEAVLQDLEKTNGEVEFLKQYCSSFHSFATGTSYMSELFRYLNRYWIKYSHCETGQAPVPGVYPITELSLHIWHDVAFEKLKKRLIRSIIHINRIARNERNDCFDNGEYITSTVETYFTLGLCKQDTMSLYREDLEVPFLEDTASYYSALAEELLSKEQKRCEGRMHRTTVAQARQTCCKVLVDDHADRICEDAESFLINNQTEDLRRLFSLFSELPKEQALISFKNILKKYIERSGLDVVRKFEHQDASKHPEGYIEALVQVRNKYYELIKDAFGFHPLMRTALDQACRTFANSHPRLPELLAKYAHYLMTHDKRNSSKSTIQHHLPGSPITSTPPLTDETVETKIENIGVVFCLIDDKDVFKKYYAKFLAKRLIKGSSVANDLEVQLINKLREICGCDFVSKLQKMLKDKIISKELVGCFEAWMEENDIELRRADEKNAIAIALHHSITYHCDILTAGAWPISSTAAETSLCLPADIKAHIHLFSKFYTDRSTGRKLLWVHHLSIGSVRTFCFDKQYEFSLSFFQTMILLLFNRTNELSRVAIVQLTNIPEQDVIHHVSSLVKAKILCEETNSSPVYKLNMDFSSRKLRVSAIPSSPVESPKVVKAASQEVEEDRKMALQAAIVRVLKTRRDIFQAQLHSEVVEMLQSQFVPSPAAIKQNVEILIQKEYLRPHENDPTRYLYVA